MFERDSRFKIPTADRKLWKYMDLPKFLSILHTESLFFPTINHLRNVADGWEGSWDNFVFAQTVGESTDTLNLINEKFLPVQSNIASYQIATSCWHMNDYESYAMWKIYLSSNEGIAIQTTFSKLEQSFDYTNSKWPEQGGNFTGNKVKLIPRCVEYIDRADAPENPITIGQMLYKSKSFEYEKEFRIIAKLFPIVGSPYDWKARNLDEWHQPDSDDWGFSKDVLEQIMKTKGVKIPVKIESLIENVYISPTSQQWFVDAVKALLEKFNLTNTQLHWSNNLPRC